MGLQWLYMVAFQPAQPLATLLNFTGLWSRVQCLWH